MKDSFTEETLVASANSILNFTEDAAVTFKDEMDVVYFARGVENYMQFLERASQLVQYEL